MSKLINKAVNENGFLKFIAVFFKTAIFSYSFGLFLILILSFALLNTIKLFGEFSETMKWTLIVYAIVYGLLIGIVPLEVRKHKIKELTSWVGLKATGVYIVAQILFFILFYSITGYIGSPSAIGGSEDFFLQNTFYAFIFPNAIAIFESFIFSGLITGMFMAVVKTFPKEQLVYGKLSAVFLGGFIASLFHLLSHSQNVLSLVITFLVFTFFGFLVWIDDFFVQRKGKTLLWISYPIRMALHGNIDMYQFGLTQIAFTILPFVSGVV
ncbi:MAG: hypothetical protein ACOCXG_04485 [Nanoarchaeota archaeon]